jgi:PAS domain S-box-containing protein
MTDRPGSDLPDPERARLALTHLAAIVDSSDDAIISKSLDGIIQTWNRGAERMFGYTAAEAIGQPVTLFIPPELAGEEASILDRIRRGERIDHSETIRMRKDGSRLPISLTVSPIRDGGGRVVGACKIARDITDRLRGQMAVEQLAAIVESADDAIIGKNLDGVIESWNTGAQRLYGYSAAEAIGRHIGMLIPPTQPDELPAIMARLRRGERIEHYETQRVRNDGTRIHVSITISPVRNARGEICGASAIARDISDRVRLEAERRRLVEFERETHVAAQRARREAEEAANAKDELLAVVSHELRTPLHAMAGWLHVIGAKRDDPALFQRALDTVERNIRLQAKIIDDLIDVSRIAAGSMKLIREPVDIPPVVETSLNLLRPIATEKGVELASVVSPWAGPVLGDPERLQQVIGNLVANAIKFTPAPGRVEVQAQNDGSHVQVTVSDTGQGIAPDFLPHVFEAFRQAERGAVHRRGGLGLGLAIVQRLVELHGGTVEAESPGVGKGARFIVRLPLLNDPSVRRLLL